MLPALVSGAVHVEIFLQLWDEMDDWLAACRQALERTLT